MTAHRKVAMGLIGLGGRGADVYSDWVLNHPEHAQIVAVAEPDVDRRAAISARHRVPDVAAFSDWQPMCSSVQRLGIDAIVIGLPDHLHVPCLLDTVATGLPILVEKPLSHNEADLAVLARAVRAHEARVVVAHVLRFAPFWRTVQALVAGGTIGRPVTVRLEENIGFWHFAHSYVRGNWSQEEIAHSLALSKNSHDFDLIRWLAGRPPRWISSAGGLSHFTDSQAPGEVPDRCSDGCEHAASCPFDAVRTYVQNEALAASFPSTALGGDPRRALTTGPYGRCVYRSANTIADHQQTLLAFPDGLTATLTTSAFTGRNTRTVQITGTAGELRGDMEDGVLYVDQFVPGMNFPESEWAKTLETRRVGVAGHFRSTLAVATDQIDATHRGHGGGDAGLMEAFTEWVAADAPQGRMSSSFESALDSHYMAFLAERARRDGNIVTWDKRELQEARQ